MSPAPPERKPLASPGERGGAAPHAAPAPTSAGGASRDDAVDDAVPAQAMPPALDATVLLGKALVVVGIVLGGVLYVLPLTGPRWPRLALSLIFSVWGWIAWRRADAGHRDAPIVLAAGITATGWTYYVGAPFFGVQVTGVTLLLPILACLSVLGPVGVAIIGLGGVVLDMTMRGILPPELSTSPVQTFSLLLATALGWVVARLHRQYVLDVAQAHAEARESTLRQGLLEEQARFLRGFINRASHEIATPLTPMILTLGTGRPPTDEGTTRIRRNLQRLRHIADGLGAIAAVEDQPPDDLGPKRLQPALRAAMASAGVDWPIDGDGEALANPELLRAVVQEIAANHALHAPDATVRLQVGDGAVIVRQRPAGLPEGAELGAPFQRWHETSRGGLGIYSLARRMHRDGGGLHVRVADGELVHTFRFADAQPS